MAVRSGEDAVEALREVRLGFFTTRGIAYNAALITLELAVLALEAGRTGEHTQSLCAIEKLS